MNLGKNNGLIFLFVILIIAVIGSLIGNSTNIMSLAGFKEGYSNFAINNAAKNIDTGGLLTGDYPTTNRKYVTDNDYNKIWWYYPIFKVGSYAQITNNLKYQRNPDDGECVTAEFCGALYKDKNITSNIINPLPPVPDTPGTRVNYYRTPDNLFMGAQPGPILELPAF